MSVTEKQAKEILRSYLIAALFTATAGEDDPSGLDEGTPLDDKYGVSDFSDDSVEKAAKIVEKFLKKPGVMAAIDLAQEEDLPNRGRGEYSFWDLLGHDLWMTQNGHGVGFWDGDWGDDEEEPAKTLNAAARSVDRERYVYVGDDGETVYLD